ncbi:MAG: class II glutamine amidotransferase, partial [Gemmatimonadota bacterium]
MCRLFGFRSTHPTRVECGLIEAQNSLVRQSREDARGLDNPDGWGLGLVRDGELSCERQVEPAHGSAGFRRNAADARATTVLAHVRRATVGEPRLANTHPFRRDGSLLAHNGHLPGFDALRPRLREATAPDLRDAVVGDTDSEHVFHLLLSRLRETDGAGSGTDVPDPARMRAVLADTLRELEGLCDLVDPDGEGVERGPDGHRLDRLAMNLLWTVGPELAGSRLGRSLWYVERDGAHRCGVCGELHPDP